MTKITNAMTLGQYAWMKGSSAMTGVRQMRARVMMLGRVHRIGRPSAQRLEHHLADGLQRIEDSVTADRHGLEIGSTAHPIAADLIYQILTGVRWVGRHLLHGRI